MKKSMPYFQLFSYSGMFIFIGLGILIGTSFKIAARKRKPDVMIVGNPIPVSSAKIIDMKE
jgi:hypothetical protein